jgi:hypothetical protein
MIRSITKDKQDTLKSLLSTNTPYSRIQKQLSNISLATISRYKAKFFPTTKPAITGRSCSISNTVVTLAGAQKYKFAFFNVS